MCRWDARFSIYKNVDLLKNNILLKKASVSPSREAKLKKKKITKHYWLLQALEFFWNIFFSMENNFALLNINFKQFRGAFYLLLLNNSLINLKCSFIFLNMFLLQKNRNLLGLGKCQVWCIINSISISVEEKKRQKFDLPNIWHPGAQPN